MNKVLGTIAVVFMASTLYAQTVVEVRTVYESGKVAEWAEPQDMKDYVFMGQVPVTWENSSIAKPKMTCVMIGGNILYRKQKGGYDAYSSYKIDLALVQRILSAKSKLKVMEKLSIKKGPQGYLAEKMDAWGQFENPRQEGEYVFIDGKIPGEPVKTFLITRANETQWVLKTHEEKNIINYIIQVN